MRTYHITGAAARAACKTGVLGMSLALICAGPPQVAMAAQAGDEVTYDNCVLSAPPVLSTVVAHEVGTFASNSPTDAHLTGWIKLPHENGWHCTRYSNWETVYNPPAGHAPRLAVGLDTEINDAAASSSPISIGNDSFTVYTKTINTGPPSNSSVEISYVLRQRLKLTIPGSSNPGLAYPSASGHKAITNTVAGRQIRSNNSGNNATAAVFMPCSGPNAPCNNTYNVTVESEIRLLKAEGDFPQVGQPIEFEVATLKYWTENKIIGNGAKPWLTDGAPKAQVIESRPARRSLIRVWFNRNDKTCTTPAQTDVPLPTVLTSQFSGPGSVAGNTPFTLQLSNCSGVSEIQYKLIPSRLETTHWPTSHANGTLPLSNCTNPSGPSTATGVGIQVLAKDNSGTFDKVTFDRDSILLAPPPNSANASSISLQAQYIQTSASITPGTACATMKVLYMYK